jgi:metal-responsive CopG/Arc/MetJ family transcriptional regulator
MAKFTASINDELIEQLDAFAEENGFNRSEALELMSTTFFEGKAGMRTIKDKLELFAYIIYEIRVLLSHHLGSKDPDCLVEKMAAHLAWSFHNEAEAIFEGKDFDVENSAKKLKGLDRMFHEGFSERFERATESTQSKNP